MLEPNRWSRVVPEGVAIVGSILLAFGVQAWWDQRDDRIAESEYLAAIHDEIERNLDALTGNITVAQDAHDALQRAQRLLETRLHGDSAAVFLESVLHGSRSGGPPRVATAVFDELTSTGRIVIIENLDLRRAILELYAIMQVNLERMARNAGDVDAQMLSVVARHLPPGIAERAPVPLRYVIDTSGLSSQELRNVAEAIASDPAFHGEMRAEFLEREDAKASRARYRAALIEARGLLAAHVR